ncbi:hypothetical protein AAG906_015198 [Vitis piasezkii]
MRSDIFFLSGSYMVNWSPNLQTAVSDLEVEYSEEPGTLYYIKYRVAGEVSSCYTCNFGILRHNMSSMLVHYSCLVLHIVSASYHLGGPSIGGLSLGSLSKERSLRRRELEELLVKEEEKTLGPDGFTIAVYQECWDAIKEDLMRVFLEFHTNEIINQSTNATFIALVPKKEGVQPKIEILDEGIVSKWPLSYLGPPLGGNPKTIGFWDPDFLWFGAGEGKKDHLIRWDVVCKQKECPWKAIAQVFQGFSPYIRLVVGNGERIRFWEDLWRGNQPLCSQFPGLYRVVYVKNLTISVVLGNSYPLSWNFNFDFSNHVLFIMTKFLWRSKAPSKVKALAWLVVHGKVNTNDKLQLRRPYKSLCSQWCILCKGNGESIDHLFLHCPLTIGLWHKLFNLAGLDWVPPRSIEDMMIIAFRGLENSIRDKKTL